MGRKGHGRYGKHSRRDRRKKKGGIISTVILIVAICVFAFSAFQLYKIFNGYHKGESEYDDLVKLAVTEDKGEQENGTDDQDGSRFSVDFDALRQINPDVVAWIRFDEPAVINYPVVQGSDNSEYLSKTFKGYDNTVGTIFVNAIIMRILMTETRSFTDIICIMERCLMSWSSITKKVSGKNTLPSIFIHRMAMWLLIRFILLEW